MWNLVEISDFKIKGNIFPSDSSNFKEEEEISIKSLIDREQSLTVNLADTFLLLI